MPLPKGGGIAFLMILRYNTEKPHWGIVLFCMLLFKKLELSDKDSVEPFLLKDGCIMTDRSFASLYVWGDFYDVRICFKDEFLYFMAKDHEGRLTYYMPLGSGDLVKAFSELEKDSAERGNDFHVMLLTAAAKNLLEEKAPGKYTFIDDRENYDYIYNAEDLINLTGKKYHSKRNFINRFMAEYEGRWSYENIDPELHRDCLHEYTLEWGRRRSGDGYAADYKHELDAVDCMLENYNVLNMRGGILRLDGKIIAYTLASLVTQDVIDVMIEKADADIDGSYQMINNQFAIHNFQDVLLVNREEDMGIEGLRRAKLSYYPVTLVEKYIALPTRD